MLSPTKDFGVVYRKLLDDLLNPHHAVMETNERTGSRVLVIPHAQAFQLDMSEHVLPTCGLRKLYPKTAAAEIAWFLKGSSDAAWLDERGVKIWNEFANDNSTKVPGAYGYRWRKKFGRDQIADAVMTLQRNPSDRQCFVSAWDPGADGLGRKAKNFPCPVGFSLHIIGGKLHCSVFMRSSDVFVGLPYDVMGHAMLMAVMANWIDPALKLGTLTFTLAHAHLYEAHWQMARIALRYPLVRNGIPLIALGPQRPDWDLFIAEYGEASRKANWPEFNPRPELVL